MAWYRHALALFAAGALVVCASAQQPADTVILHGIVIDKATRMPLAGARISLYRAGSEAQQYFTSAVADSDGRFEVGMLKAKDWTINVTAKGYSSRPDLSTLSTLPGELPTTVELALTRLATLRGVLIDDETRKPIAGMRVRLVLLADNAMIGGMPNPVTTRADGSFQFDEMPDTEMFLQLSGIRSARFETIPAKDLQGDGREKALQAPDPVPDYGVRYWPGGDREVSAGARGLLVRGSDLDLGEIRLDKRRPTNLTGVVQGCDEGASMQAILTSAARRDDTLRYDLKCGEGWRILDLSPSTFLLTVTQGGPPRKFVAESITSASRGTITSTLSPMSALRIELAVEGAARDAFPADLENIRPEIRAEDVNVKINGASKLSSGLYEVDVFPGLRYRLTLRLSPKYYLKGAENNGVRLPEPARMTSFGGVLRLQIAGPAGRIETQGGIGLPFAVREGQSYEDALGDARDRIPVGGILGSNPIIAGLAPGTYRVFFGRTSNPTIAEFEDGLRRAVRVSIEEGATAKVDLPAQ